jgi:site-specific recombinase XerD
MTISPRQRRHHFKNTTPTDAAITPFGEWPVFNRSFHIAFYRWMKAGGYGPSSLSTYSVAARLALGYLNKPHWKIKAEADLDRVRQYMEILFDSDSTRREYNKGLLKLAEYLRLRQNKAPRPRMVNWNHHLNGLPAWLADHVREFVAFKQKSYPPENRHRRTVENVSTICTTLRWMAEAATLTGIGDITPTLWFDFVDARVSAGMHPNTINSRLSRLKAFLHYLDEAGHPICPRILLVDTIKVGPHAPKDVPIGQLRRLLAEIEREAGAMHAWKRRMGTLDRAWVHLMLFSGLRTCEVRGMRSSDVDWESCRVRIEGSKGLKDRLVYMNTATIEALKAWLKLRRTAEFSSDHVFLYRHKPLSRRYCQVRLRTYAKRTGHRITPHQLRHSCATLLLNAGAPIVTVQTLLGHQKIDTTLAYARLYDSTVAADYYRAMGAVEARLALVEGAEDPAPDVGQLLALVDALSGGTLNGKQKETLQALREGIMAQARQWELIDKIELGC